MRPGTIEQPFNFPLSAERLAEIAREMAQNLSRVRELEDRFDAAKEAKKEVPGIMQHIRELGSFIENGAESRNVICRVEYDTPVVGVKRIIRTDTEEVVDECEMTDAESQGELFVPPDGPLTLPDPDDEEKEDDKGEPGTSDPEE